MGPTVTGPEQDSLAVTRLEKQLYMSLNERKVLFLKLLDTLERGNSWTLGEESIFF